MKAMVIHYGRIMTKFVLTILFLAISFDLFAQKIPNNGSSFDQELDLSSFYTISNFQKLYFKFNYLNQELLSNQTHYEVNYRYNLSNHWQTAFIFRRSYGLRHNEDWNNSSGSWMWKDTSSRGENFTGVMLQYKNILWGRGQFILKNRATLIRNWFNDQDSLIYKLGILNFSWPDWTSIHQFELTIPLNYMRSFYSEIWHYSAFMYRFNHRIQMGPKFTIGRMLWNESLQFKSMNNNTFNQHHYVYRLGLGLIIDL